jgi:tetratricopeptide (TPR) repeat protein
LIVAVLGARLFRHRLSGIIGGALFLLAPVPLYFEGELLIEPSYTFLICVSLLLLLSAAEKTGWKGAALWLSCGALIILASQARANIFIFLAVFPLFALWRWWRTRQWAAWVPLCGCIGALAMAVPWGLVNRKQADRFYLVPNAGGVALYLGNKRTADGMVPEQGRRITYGDRYEDSVEVWAREEYQAAMRAEGREPETDPMAISRYWTRRTVDEIKSAPGTWLRLMAKKSWLTLWNAEVPNNKAFSFLQEEFVWLRLLPVRWVVLLMFAPAGIWLAVRRGNRDALVILLIYAALYSAGNIAFFICDRYRYPVWPAAAAFAGGGLMILIETIRLRQWRTVTIVTASMAVMAALSLPNWLGAKLPSFARDYLFRSIAWYEKGRFAEALNDIDRSVQLDSRDATALHHRGNVLFALNRLPEAKDAYEQTLKLNPEDGSVWNNLGTTLDALGRNEEALQSFVRATQCQPPNQNAFLGIAFVQIRSGRLDDAVNALDQLERLQRPNAVSLATRSVVERRRGNAQAADNLERQARAIDPEAAGWAIDRATKGK